MKIVIEIDENTYNRIISGFANEDDAGLFEELFKNGIQLPKGHGDLIDMNDLKDFCQTHEVGTSVFDGELLYDAGSTSRGDTIWKPLLGKLKPIIEADRAESEETK